MKQDDRIKDGEWLDWNEHMEIRMPAHAEEIINRLNEYGYEAYIVGGCVRDMLLGREPGDWDITTSALPAQVKQVFGRTVDTGIRHGTVTVLMGKESYEVTTYRIDGEYSDGRHPNQVEFTASLTEDLKRRDFTINAMAYSRRAGFVDEFGGREDLRKGIIRCVGKPMDRFTEDALRILRAIRFSAQLGFSIEHDTYGAISEIAPNMVHVSKERIQAELTKLLLSSHPGHMALVYATGISPFVSQAFQAAYCGENGNVYGRNPGMSGEGSFVPWASTPFIPTAIPPKRHMRWAAFLRKCTPDRATAILKDLKLDNDTIYRVKTLVTWQGMTIFQDKHAIRLVMSKMEPELFDDLLLLKLCLAKADCPGMEKRSETEGELEYVIYLANEIRGMGDCISLKSLAVDGHDIMEAGVQPGKEVGETLSRLLELVLEEPGRNTKEYLLKHLW